MITATAHVLYSNHAGQSYTASSVESVPVSAIGTGDVVLVNSGGIVDFARVLTVGTTTFPPHTEFRGVRSNRRRVLPVLTLLGVDQKVVLHADEKVTRAV